MLPERVEDVAIFHKDADRSREFLPERLVDAPFSVLGNQLPEIVAEGGALIGRYRLKFALVGICGVKRNSEKDEACVFIVAASLCAAYPVDRAVRPKIHRFRKAIANAALLGFQRRVVWDVHSLPIPFLGPRLTRRTASDCPTSQKRIGR